MVSTLWKQKKDCFITKGVKNGNSSSDWRWNRNIKSIWVNNPKNQRTFNQLSKRFFDVYSIKLWFMFNVYRNLMRYAAKLIQKHHFLAKNGVFHSFAYMCAFLLTWFIYCCSLHQSEKNFFDFFPRNIFSWNMFFSCYNQQ